MASGNRRIRINTQERAISADINRLQQFQNQDFGEFLRLLLNMSTDDETGLVTEPVTLGTPLVADIVNGFMVRPIAGSFALTVDAGIMGALAPDGAVDDSNYKYMRDPGIPSAGVLALTANASGSIRIDVIECSVNATDATVSDSRDIFNPATGLFSATSVTKEVKGQLTYRVRAGTPGSGMPANQSGWLPLCVASVPTGSTTNDTVTFWDVRPMIGDRSNGIVFSAHEFATPHTSGNVATVTAGSVSTLTGSTRAVANGRRLGGTFRRGTPGTDGNSIVLSDAANQEPGFAVTLNALSYVYLLTPFGLPRWARYTDGPSGRTPRAPFGIPVLSLVTPDNHSGAPQAAVSLPTSTGLGGSTTVGACVASGMMYTGFVMMTAIFSGTQTNVWTYPTTAGVSINAALYKFTLTPGLTFPKHARRILAMIQLTQTVAANNYIDNAPQLAVYQGSYGSPAPNVGFQLSRGPLVNPTAGSLGQTWAAQPIWLPVPQQYPAGTAAFDVTISTGTVTVGPFLSVVGWDVSG